MINFIKSLSEEYEQERISQSEIYASLCEKNPFEITDERYKLYTELLEMNKAYNSLPNMLEDGDFLKLISNNTDEEPRQIKESVDIETEVPKELYVDDSSEEKTIPGFRLAMPIKLLELGRTNKKAAIRELKYYVDLYKKEKEKGVSTMADIPIDVIIAEYEDALRMVETDSIPDEYRTSFPGFKLAEANRILALSLVNKEKAIKEAERYLELYSGNDIYKHLFDEYERVLKKIKSGKVLESTGTTSYTIDFCLDQEEDLPVEMHNEIVSLIDIKHMDGGKYTATCITEVDDLDSVEDEVLNLISEYGFSCEWVDGQKDESLNEKKSIIDVKKKKGTMHRMLGLKPHESIPDNFDDGEQLAKALLKKTKKSTAQSLLNYAANINRHADPIFREASDYIKANETKEWVLWGVKIGESDHMEEIMYNDSKEIKINDRLKTICRNKGYDRLRVSEIDVEEKPNFMKSVNEAKDRIDSMVDHWNENGWASSELDNDDAAFFRAIKKKPDEIAFTSFTGNDIKYYDPSRVKKSVGGFTKVA